MKSKSLKQIPSQTDTSNFTLDIVESPILEATSSEGVFNFKDSEVELDGEDRPCLIRLSALSALKPVPTDQDTTVHDSAEQLYICPIMSNVCVSETANQ